MPRKARKARPPAIESYLFEIGKISPSYSFQVGNARFDRGAYGEHLHIDLTASCLRPRNLEGRATEFTFIGDRSLIADMEASARGGTYPNGVGTLTVRGKQSDYLGSLPFDVATSLTLMVLHGGFRFIYLSGPPLYRGSSRIGYSAFYRDYDPDEL